MNAGGPAHVDLTGHEPLSEFDEQMLREAAAAGAAVRRNTSPNPWVGAVLIPADARAGDATGARFVGATAPPGGNHAEVAAIARAAAAGVDTTGATLYVTLEPCAHHGRTPPCVDAIVSAGISRVVVGLLDPDQQVSGRGVQMLRANQIRVDIANEVPDTRFDETELATQLGRGALDPSPVAVIKDSLRAYLHQRRTGRPWVVLKVAASLDGKSAAADGTSQWITGPAARADGHEWRADSDAIVVGAGTVRADNPRLTARPGGIEWAGRQPRRIVLGHAPASAAIQPCESWTRDKGSPADLLDTLSREGVLQVLLEGGPTVAGEWHRAGLVDEYLWYVAPGLLGSSAVGAVADTASPVGRGSISDMWRGEIVDLRQLGDDVRIVMRPRAAPSAAGGPEHRGVRRGKT